jgi:hypothetical protein
LLLWIFWHFWRGQLAWQLWYSKFRALLFANREKTHFETGYVKLFLG